MNEDRSARYHRLKRRTAAVSTAWSAALLAFVMASGASAALRDGAGVMADGQPTLAVAFYASFLILMHEVGALPMAFYSGYLVELRYGLSTEPVTAWARDQAKSLGLALVFGTSAATVVYACIRWSPRAWWAVAGAIVVLAFTCLASLAPVLLLPLFYSLKPLGRESLRLRLLRLADRAGTRVLGAFEWGLAEKTTKANAALAGLGFTRRILVSDTMLAQYSDEEIEVVLAHEMAHHVHGDIWRGLLFESAVVLVGFYVGARGLQAAMAPLSVSDPGDVAGLPLLVLSAAAVSLITRPVSRAMSRVSERRADRFALQLTRNPDAFVSAMRRLGAQNLAEEQPSRLVQWLFYSHPPVRERIAAAQAFKP